MVSSNQAKSMSNEELAQAWLKNAEAAAALEPATNVLNRQIGEAIHIERELNRRGEAAIRHILPFLDHPFDRVRCLAAELCYAIAPDQCSEALIAISSDGGPAGIDAAIALIMLDKTALERLMTPKFKKRMEERDAFFAKMHRELNSPSKS
jgi:hypothetical protein